MNVTMIFNPVAGSNCRLAKVRRLVDRLSSAGIRVTIRTTTGRGDARHFAETAAGRADAVVILGGDGTIREAAEGLVRSDTPIVVWPTGTENLVAKALGFRRDPELIFSCLTAGRVVPFDLGHVNERSFLVIAGIGFDAEAVHRLSSMRKGNITHLTYAGPLCRTFFEHRFPPMRVIVDGKPFWRGRGMVFFGNIARYALGLPIVRDARADDGLLDMLILPCRNQMQLLGNSLRVVLNRHIEHPSSHYVRLHTARIESDCSVPVELDGDPAGHLPIDVSVERAVLRLKLPPSLNNG